MGLRNRNEPFILNEFSYSRNEEAEARIIRAMPDGEEKTSLVKYFEIETGKGFPFVRPIKIGYNMCTALLDSREIERSAAQIDSYMCEARTKILF